MRISISIQKINPLLLRSFSLFVVTTLLLQLMVSSAWADIERQKRPVQVMEWISLAGRMEFEKSHKKNWKDASAQERGDFIQSLPGRPEQEVSYQAQQPKFSWLLSQPAFKPQNSKIRIALRFPIGHKPNFSKEALLTKRFNHTNFGARSHNARSFR